MPDAILSLVGAVTSLEAIFVLSGVLLIVFGGFTFADRANPARMGTGMFWILLGVAFVFGSILPAWATGALVIAMVVIDGFGRVRHGAYNEATHEERVRAADRFGWRIFLPVLMIPTLTYASSLVPWGPGVDPNRVVFVSLGYASVLAALIALALTGGRPVELVHEGRRLADAIGAVVILPQLLASLGTLFKTAGVGDVIAKIVGAVIPAGNLFAVVLVCCLSIVCFTVIMGNSFAAFPVIMAGVGVPLLVTPFNADAALVGAVVLTCASCGTLCTPMAANFNMVPPALFEMRDQYGVIKFQAPFAAVMLVVHVVLLWALVATVQHVP
jgi:uncharacterized membrane protein